MVAILARHPNELQKKSYILILCVLLHYTTTQGLKRTNPQSAKGKDGEIVVKNKSFISYNFDFMAVKIVYDYIRLLLKL